MGRSKYSLQPSTVTPVARNLLSGLHAREQEHFACVCVDQFFARPRHVTPSAEGKKTVSRTHQSSSSSFSKHTARRQSAAINKSLRIAVDDGLSKSKWRRATTRPRAPSVGPRPSSRGFASVAPEGPQAPDETPVTRERDQRVKGTLRQLDMDETAALVERIADTLANATARPPWAVGRQKAPMNDSTRATSSAILAKIGPILHQLRSPRQFRQPDVLFVAKKIFEQAAAVPKQQRTTFFNARIVTLVVAIFRFPGHAGVKPSKAQALEWIRSYAMYDALDHKFLTGLVEFLAVCPSDTVPASLSELLALPVTRKPGEIQEQSPARPGIPKQTGIQHQSQVKQDQSEGDAAELYPRVAQVLPKPVSNFDFAVALLHAVSRDPTLQPTRVRPYIALLDLAAAKTDAYAGLELLALMQENDSLPADYLDPRTFFLILRSIVGDKLLRPEELNVDTRQSLSQHTIPPLSADDVWKRDALEVVQAVFDIASPRWSLEDASKPANLPDTRAERQYIDTSDGVFRTSNQSRPLLTAWNGLIHAHFLVGYPEGAIALFKRMADARIADPHPTMDLHTPPPTRETASIMLVGLAATRGVSTAAEWCSALLTDGDPVPLPSFEGLVSLAASYAQSAKDETAAALWDGGMGSGAYSRLLEAITGDLRGKHQRRKFLPFDLLDALVSPGVVGKMEESQVSHLLALLGACFASSTVPRGHDGPLDRTTQFGSSLLFLADKCMSYGRAADAASILTYVLRWTTLSSEAALGGSPNEYRLKTATQRRKLAAVAKRMLQLIRLTRRIPTEEAGPAAAALLGTAVTTFAPMLELYPSLLHGVVDKSTALPRAHLWATRLVGLYRQATPNDRDAVLSCFSADEWTVIIRAFAHEEQHLVPDQARMVSSGLGMVAEDYARAMPAMAGRIHSKNGYLVRPDVEQAAGILLARYPEAEVIPLLEQFNPSYFRILHLKPWDTTAIEYEAPSPLSPATELPQISARAQKALGSVQPSANVSSDPRLSFVPVSELSEDLDSKVLEMLNSTMTSKVHGTDVRLQRTWDLLLSNARQGVYPTPALLTALINIAAVRRDMDHARLLYLLASHVIRSLKGIAQASAWVEVENAMICAAACSGQCRLANSHRHVLLNAGQVPMADTYGSLIAASRATTDEVYVSKELFDEAIRLGVKPNLHLFNTVISTFSRARRADLALAHYKMMQGYKVRPSSITYGALINAFVGRGEINQALQFYQRMEASPSFRPSATPYNALIGYFVQQGDRASALELINKMRAYKLSFSSYSWKLVLDAYGLIDPVDDAKLVETFNEIAAAKKVEGMHLATLITSYGINRNNLKKARGIYESITPLSGRRIAEPLPDAVCHQAMMEVLEHHKRVDLLFDFIERLALQGTHFTAYHANIAIRAYGTKGEHGLTEARRVFASMRDPATGAAAIDTGRADSKDNKENVVKLPSYYAALMPAETGVTADATAATVFVIAPAQSTDAAQFSSSISTSPWQHTFRDSSTYITMIQTELAAGHLEAAQWLHECMNKQAFSAPTVNQVRTLIADYERVGPAALTTHPLFRSRKPHGNPPAPRHRQHRPVSRSTRIPSVPRLRLEA